MSVFFQVVRRILQPSRKKYLWISTNISKYRPGTLAVIIAHCVSNGGSKKNLFEYPDPSQLSHEHLIKQACTSTVNSACQLLTCTLLALVDIVEKYRKAAEDQLSLMEESLNSIGNEEVQNQLTDMITAARSNVDTLKKAFLELVSLMEYVDKLVEAATETSFLAGAETACAVLSERLYSAKIMVDEQKQLVKKLEEEIIILHKEIIKKSRPPGDKKRGN